MTFQGLRDHLPEAKVRPVFGLAFGRGDSFYHTLPPFLLFVGLALGMLASAWAASTETVAWAVIAPQACPSATHVTKP